MSVSSFAAAAPLQTADDPFQLVLERHMQMGYEVRLIQCSSVFASSLIRRLRL